MLARIHNNPKLEGPRMPLILPEEAIDSWLNEAVETDAEKEKILSLIKPYTEAGLTAHPVSRLRGKSAVGNNPIATNPVHYPELDEFDEKPDQGKLF